MSIWWKIGGGLILAAALFFLVKLYGGAQYRAGKNEGQLGERAAWQGKVAEAAEAKLTGFQLGIALQRQAETQYEHTTTERIIPVTRTIIERASAYAQTPAGQLVCLSPDRVLGLDQARGTLFPAPAPVSPGGEPGPVPADAEGQER